MAAGLGGLDSLITAEQIIAAIAELDPVDAPAVMLALAARISEKKPVPQPAPPEQPNAKPAESADSDRYVTVPEAAKRIRRAPMTLYHWISEGKLNSKTGLRRVQGQPLIEWPVFERAFIEKT